MESNKFFSLHFDHFLFLLFYFVCCDPHVEVLNLLGCNDDPRKRKNFSFCEEPNLQEQLPHDPCLITASCTPGIPAFDYFFVCCSFICVDTVCTRCYWFRSRTFPVVYFPLFLCLFSFRHQITTQQSCSCPSLLTKNPWKRLLLPATIVGCFSIIVNKINQMYSYKKFLSLCIILFYILMYNSCR